MLSGMLGILSQPLDFFQSWVQGRRFKNPIEPPATAIPKSFGDFMLSVYERGLPKGLEDFQAGWLSDAGRAVENVMPGVRGAVDTAGNYAAKMGLSVQAIEVMEARRQVRNLRKASARWAKETGLETNGLDLNRISKKPFTATYDRVSDALLIGDYPEASKAAEQYLATLPADKRAGAMKSLKLSVKQREPIKAGSHHSAQVKRDFLDWAVEKLPPAQVEEIERLQRTYEQAAQMAGLW